LNQPINQKMAEDELMQLLQVDLTAIELDAKNLDPKKCSARQYVETFIFPTLLPGLNDLFQAAKDNLVFEKRRTKFNACDFLTEYLYNNNPTPKDREKQGLWDIPFVKEINGRNPRPPIPLSLIWTEAEAALVIQSHWKGYLVRKEPEVQELRQYQKEMKESSYHIMFKVEEFWKQHKIEDLDEAEEVIEDTLIKTDFL